MRPIRALALALGLVSFADLAHAEESPIEAKAREALSAGRIDEACALFEKAVAVEATPPATLLIAAAQCHELQGKSATAYREYTDAALVAGRNAELDLADRARGLAGRLAPRLSKLRVDVSSPAPNQVVRQNGAPLAPSSWGALAAVDPGTYVIQASAPNLQPFSTQVTVKPDADVQVVVIPALSLATSTVDPEAPIVPAPKKPEVVRTISPMNLAGFITTSVGAVGIAMGIAFGVMALNEKSEADDDPTLCDDKVCSPAGLAVIDEARTKAVVSTVAFSVGGVALGTGIVLFLVKAFTNVEDPAPVRPPVRPVVGLGFVGVEADF